jgi:thymidylate kinase
MTGVDHFGLARSELGRSRIPCWPGLVIYLDVLPETVQSRNRGKFVTDSIFVDERFNAGIRKYFVSLREASQPPVVWLDASLPSDTLCDQAWWAIDGWLTHSAGARDMAR